MYDCLKYVYPGALGVLNYMEVDVHPTTTAIRTLTANEMLEVVKAFRRWPYFSEQMIYQPDRITNDDDDVDGGAIEGALHTW